MAESLFESLSEWAASEERGRSDKFEGYVYGIAQARYVVRRVFRIVDDEAKKLGLDSLQHQALLQLLGAGRTFYTVTQLAERIDVAPAFASRVVRDLVDKGYVKRRSDATDRRVTKLEVTRSGVAVIRAIDEAVHVHVAYFQSQLKDEERSAALAIFCFYLGFNSPERLTAIISSSRP